MKIFTSFSKLTKNLFREKRVIFDNEAAPPSPESFKGPEKATDAQIANEVASSSPSQIMSSAIGRAGVIAHKYTKSTQNLAGLMGGAQSSSAQSSTKAAGAQSGSQQDDSDQSTGQNNTTPTSSKQQNIAKS